MQSGTDPFSEELVSQLISFGSSICNAESAVFFWVDDDFEVVDPVTTVLPFDFMDTYYLRARACDPITVQRIFEDGRNLAMLCADRDRFPGWAGSSYRQHLDSLDLSDEVDMIFLHEGRPTACLSLYRRVGEPPFASDLLDWENLRRYFQITIKAHWRVREKKAAHQLISRYDLKRREMEVLRLVGYGKANAEIASVLDISVSTVKTHIINIFNKMGVESRSAAASRVSALQFS